MLDDDPLLGPALPDRMCGAVAVPGQADMIYILSRYNPATLLQADMKTEERVVISR